MNALTTSQVARQGGVNLASIRFYERKGLLPRPPRTASGYRKYPPDAVRRVQFIKRAQELGFALKEIKELLELRVDMQTNCAEIRDLVEAKQVEIENKIRDLRRMGEVLTELTATCRPEADVCECPILEALDSEPESKGAKS